MHGDNYFEGERRNADGTTIQRAPFCEAVISGDPPRGCLARTRHPSRLCGTHRSTDQDYTDRSTR